MMLTPRPHVRRRQSCLHVRRRHAKVNKELFYARHLGAFGIVGNVDWLAARIHDAVDVTAVGDHRDAASKEVAGVKATSGVQPDEAVVINVSNIEANLVHVRSKKHSGWLGTTTGAALGGVARADQRAHCIDMGCVKQSTARLAKHGLFNHRTHALFATRNAGGFAQATEEFNIKAHSGGYFAVIGATGVARIGDKRDGKNKRTMLLT